MPKAQGERKYTRILRELGLAELFTVRKQKRVWARVYTTTQLIELLARSKQEN